MAFMLKVRWNIRPGERAAFEANQRALCAVMLEHPGVICYHATYPDESTSEWVEIYANDAAFKAHLDNDKGKAPLAAVAGRLRVDRLPLLRRPGRRFARDPEGLRHHLPSDRGDAFVVNPRADRNSQV